MSEFNDDRAKKRRINRERKKLKAIFEEMPQNDFSLVEPLLQNAAFMKIILEDLQSAILIEGATDEYQNGENQKGTKASANLQAYNTTFKNFHATIMKLLERLPKESESRSKLAKFMEIG